ncbi:MAG: hypothetical protein WKG01_04225 [Kofleriaceae bacterium]
MFRSERTVMAARVQRIAFGVVLIAGAGVLFDRLISLRAGEIHAWAVLPGAWAAAFFAGALARRFAPTRVRDPERWLLASLVLPGVGISMMLPLLVHLPFALVLGGRHGFDSWAQYSLEITGTAHGALALLVVARATGLVRGTGFTPTPHKIYLVVVIVACIPYIVLFAIPPLLVALTGIAIVPLLRHMAVIVEAERAVLTAVPTAITRVKPRTSSVLPARAGRIAFGTALIAGAGVLVHRVLTSEGVLGARTRPEDLWTTSFDQHPVHAWRILVGAWVVAWIAGGLAYSLVDRLRRTPRDADRWLLASFVVPGVGIALTLPLLMHLPLAIGIGALTSDTGWCNSFDAWVWRSLLLTGVPHVAFAVLIAKRSHGLVTGRGFTPTPRQCVLGAMFVACIPGILLFGVPPILVGLTGMLIEPILARMPARIASERAILNIPQALVVDRR